MQRLTVLLALALAGNVAAEFGQKEGLAEALNDAPAPSVDEENARLRAEVASLRGRLHLPSIADGQTPPPNSKTTSSDPPASVTIWDPIKPPLGSHGEYGKIGSGVINYKAIRPQTPHIFSYRNVTRNLILSLSSIL